MAFPLIALKDTYYDGPIKAGTRFVARQADEAKWLKALGRAKDAPVVPPIDQPAVGVDSEDDMPLPQKRRYRRRDLTADPA